MYWTKQPWLLSVELWVVNIACSQKVDASCSANSGREESISRFFVTGTLRNLVLRGESAGHDRKRSSLKNYAECQYGSQNFILLWLRKTQNQLGAAARSFVCVKCGSMHTCVSLCARPRPCTWLCQSCSVSQGTDVDLWLRCRGVYHR